MKEIIYTAVFAVLGIVLILLLLFMFLPEREKHTDKEIYTWELYFHRYPRQQCSGGRGLR